MYHTRSIVIASWMLLASPPALVLSQTVSATPASPASLIIRTDDIGMSHSVNMAMQKLIGSGLPVSVSVLFVCPWYQEVVEILKQHPEVSVGIHLALNSEWKNYRWGPITGSVAVPTPVRVAVRRGAGSEGDSLVTHVGIDDAELRALLDMNTDEPLPNMSKNRQGELTALPSPRFGAALKARHVVLLTYRDLIARAGLKSMRRPVG
ncbi:MAG: ChbG/HpnK family deacetylase [Gemmatimonadales bacterium]